MNVNVYVFSGQSLWLHLEIVTDNNDLSDVGAEN